MTLCSWHLNVLVGLFVTTLTISNIIAAPGYSELGAAPVNTTPGVANGKSTR